jgi:hypothetical protein
LSIGVVALSKIDTATAQVLLLSIIATNFFLLLGLGRIYYHKRRQARPNTIASLHTSALLASIVFALIPITLPTIISDSRSTTSSYGNTEVAPSALVVVRTAAIISLLVYASQIFPLCYEKADLLETTNGLLRFLMLDNGNSGATNSLKDMDVPAGLGDNRPKKQVLEMTDIKVIFVASSVMQPVLCIFLLDSMVLNQEQWSTSVFCKIMITALVTGLAGLAACYLHAQQLKLFEQDMYPTETRTRQIVLVTRLLFVAHPACILVQWADHVTSLSVMAPFPAALFFAAYFFETRIDDLYVLAVFLYSRH